MLKSKIKLAREARKKVSAFPARHSLGDGGSLSTLRSRATAEDGQPSAFACCSAFTLLELLIVIAILGIMAGMTVPVLKNFRQSDATLSASRQLLDGVSRARQLAVSQRTTVYMVFVPTNFWANDWTFDHGATFQAAWNGPNGLALAQRAAVTNLLDKQLTGYTFVARGAVGDQPGQHAWHYLEPWQNLPDGTFISMVKMTNSLTGPAFIITDPVNSTTTAKTYPIRGFATNGIPFPTGTNAPVNLPYVAFNYLGQLTDDGQLVANFDEFIPLAHGGVIYAADQNKVLGFGSPAVDEMPPGNSTNSSYNIVHIDRLTGRAVLEFQKLQ